MNPVRDDPSMKHNLFFKKIRQDALVLRIFYENARRFLSLTG